MVAQMNVLSTARLFVSDVILKAQIALDPDLKLYQMPQRDLIQSEQDIYIIAKAFPEKTRTEFLGETHTRTLPPATRRRGVRITIATLVPRRRATAYSHRTVDRLVRGLQGAGHGAQARRARPF